MWYRYTDLLGLHVYTLTVLLTEVTRDICLIPRLVSCVNGQKVEMMRTLDGLNVSEKYWCHPMYTKCTEFKRQGIKTLCQSKINRGVNNRKFLVHLPP